MTYLILSVFFSILIANILRKVSARDKDIYVIFWGNYLVASIYSLFSGGMIEFEKVHTPDILLGALTGLLFLINFFIYSKNINVNGLSISVSAMRISVLIPIVVSILFFAENLTLLKSLGIFIILCAFYQMGRKGTIKSIKWVLFLFLCTGITDSCLKFYDFYFFNSLNIFLFFTFFTAFLFNTGVVLFTRSKMRLKTVLIGIMLGIPNCLTSLFFMKALGNMSAIYAYPFFASNLVLFSIISDIVFWKRRFTFREGLLFVLLITGIIFLNI